MTELIIKKLQQKPYFLGLLPLFFILHGYNAFFGFLAIKFVLLHLVAVLVITLLFYLTAFYYFKTANKTAFFCFSILLPVLTFGSIHDLLKSYTTGFFSSYSFLLPFGLLLTILLAIKLKKSRSLLQRSFNFLNIVMISFIVYEVGDSLWRFSNFKKDMHLIDNRFNAYKQYKPFKPVEASSKPDIFFLVFDGMPSTKGMKNQWIFDNSRIDSFLTKQGFYVAANAKSNYNITMLSVSSCLNMDYLLPSQIYTGGEINMIQKASPALLNNSLIKILKKENYKIHQYQPLSTNNKQWPSELFFTFLISNTYFYKTLPGRLYKDLGWQLKKFKPIKKLELISTEKEHNAHRKNISTTIDLIKSSCADSINPKFVYGHFMMPHEPFVYDSTGAKLNVELNEFDESKNVSKFIAQVKYTNKIIENLVNYIKQNNKKNTIIIIEGDHGYRNIYGKKEYLIFDNLNAIFYPDSDYSTLHPNHSPVNTFRLLLNKYFHTSYSKLADSSSYIPYDLIPKKQ